MEYIIIGLLVLIVILVSVLFYKDKTDDHFVNESSYPVAAANYILDNLDINNMKLFNEYNYGSYLLFRGIPVFIDSRADLYEDKFDKYGITHVIIGKKTKLNMFLSRSDNYIELYSDDNFVVYDRLSE